MDECHRKVFEPTPPEDAKTVWVVTSGLLKKVELGRFAGSWVLQNG